MNAATLPKAIAEAAQQRAFLLTAAERNTVDKEARTVELAFASETPIDRGWGIEILDLGSKSVRLDRLREGGAVLVNHEIDDHVGVVVSVRIDADRVARAVVRFGRSARADEIFNDVIDGIRPNISVWYRIHAAVLESEKDGYGTYRITDWEPFEITIVSIPADTSVGVGRTAHSNPGATTVPDAPNNTTTTTTTPAAPVDVAAHERSGADAERKRTTEILGIADAYSKHNLGALAAEACRSGMSVDAFRAKAMEAIAAAPKPTAEIGLDNKEAKRYSLLRALNYLANPGDARIAAAAGFEIECSRAAATKSGKSPQGLLVPFDVLKRDLTVGTPADGGNLVATELRSGNFIELLRNAMVIDKLGAIMLTGLQGNIAIPKQTGAGSAYWVAEGGAPTESKQAIAQVPMSPKTVGAFTDISRKLLLQSSIDVENFVQGDLAKVIGLAIQSVAILGGGSNEPTGILATSGIGDVAGGTNGAAPDWDDIVDLETLVAVANADVGTLAYLTNAKVRGKLKKTFVDGPGSGERVWDRDRSTPLNGYAGAVTNAVPSNLTKGTSAGVCSAILFGNFADLILGMWGGLDITVDPYTNSTSGTVRVVALQDVDVAVRHAESFAAMKDALTA